MANLQFKEPNIQRAPTNSEALAAGLTPAIQGLPGLIMQHQQLKRQNQLADLQHQVQLAELQNKMRETQAKYGTGGPAPTQTMTDEGPVLSGQQQPTSVITATETPEDIMNRMGSEGLKAKADYLKASTEKPTFFMDPSTKKLYDNVGKEVSDPSVVPTDANIKLFPNPSLSLGDKESQFYQKEFDKVIQDNNPSNASTRTPIGMIGRANLAADRALTTLMKPTVTKQEAGNVMADIASIYQSGSPTQFGMAHQEYQTLYGSAKNALQTLTGNPQDAVPDAIKQRLQTVLTDMKATNQAVLKNNLDTTEKAKRKVIQHFPEDWKAFRQSVEGNMGNGQAQQQFPALHNAALDWANANPNDPRAAAVKKKAMQEMGQ